MPTIMDGDNTWEWVQIMGNGISGPPPDFPDPRHYMAGNHLVLRFDGLYLVDWDPIYRTSLQNKTAWVCGLGVLVRAQGQGQARPRWDRGRQARKFSRTRTGRSEAKGEGRGQKADEEQEACQAGGVSSRHLSQIESTIPSLGPSSPISISMWAKQTAPEQLLEAYF